MSEMALFWEMFFEETTLLNKNRRLVGICGSFPTLFGWLQLVVMSILGFWWETEAAHFTLGTNPRTASSGKHRHGWWQPDTGRYGTWAFRTWIHSGFWGEWICDVLSKKFALRKMGCFMLSSHCYLGITMRNGKLSSHSCKVSSSFEIKETHGLQDCDFAWFTWFTWFYAMFS